MNQAAHQDVHSLQFFSVFPSGIPCLDLHIAHPWRTEIMHKLAPQILGLGWKIFQFAHATWPRVL